MCESPFPVNSDIVTSHSAVSHSTDCITYQRVYRRVLQWLGFLSKPCVLDVIKKQVNDVVHALARKSS